LPRLRTGQSVSQTFMLAAPRSAASLSTVDLHATATYSSRAGVEQVTATDPTLLISPVTAPFVAANTTGTDMFAGQSGRSFSILAGGTGISPADHHQPEDPPGVGFLRGGVRAGGASADSTALVTVAAQTGSKLRPFGSAGLLERPDMTAPSARPRAWR
jgi:hypothetical protein